MAKAVVHAPGSGRVLRTDEDVATVKLEAGATGGAFSLVEYRLAPGSGPGQHAHEDCHEAYYVVEGTLAFRLGRETHLLEPGASVHVPPGVVHGFRNETDEPVRLLWVFSPGHHLDRMGWEDG